MMMYDPLGRVRACYGEFWTVEKGPLCWSVSIADGFDRAVPGRGVDRSKGSSELFRAVFDPTGNDKYIKKH
jgi:hypothetical protein